MSAALEAHYKAPTARTLARVAHELPKAHLLVPFLGDELKTVPGERPGMVTIQESSTFKFLTPRDPDGKTLCAVFTDWDEIRRWTKDNVSTLVMPASDLQGWAFENLKAPAILLNPGGAGIRIGPELLRAALAGPLPSGQGHVLNGRFSQVADLESFKVEPRNPPDLEAAREMQELLAVMAQRRGADWLPRFQKAAKTAALVAVSPRFHVGPDLFRYLNARPATDQDGAAERFSLRDVAAAGAELGFGLVLNPQPASADWVFSCGDLLAVQLRGGLENVDEVEPLPPGLQSEKVARSEQVMVGTPSESYLPMSARRLLAEFIDDALGLANPSVLLMGRPNQRPVRQLVFSVHREDFPSQDFFASALHRMSWFLPRDYAIVAMGNDSSLLRNLTPLVPRTTTPGPRAKDKPWFKFW